MIRPIDWHMMNGPMDPVWLGVAEMEHQLVVQARETLYDHVKFYNDATSFRECRLVPMFKGRYNMSSKDLKSYLGKINSIETIRYVAWLDKNDELHYMVWQGAPTHDEFALVVLPTILPKQYGEKSLIGGYFFSKEHYRKGTRSTYTLGFKSSWVDTWLTRYRMYKHLSVKFDKKPKGQALWIMKYWLPKVFKIIRNFCLKFRKPVLKFKRAKS